MKMTQSMESKMYSRTYGSFFNDRLQLRTKKEKETMEISYTCPGCRVPTDGEIVTGAPSGTRNSNEVGPIAAISPEVHG
jgi:hypothetical protein